MPLILELNYTLFRDYNEALKSKNSKCHNISERIFWMELNFFDQQLFLWNCRFFLFPGYLIPGFSCPLLICFHKPGNKKYVLFWKEEEIPYIKEQTAHFYLSKRGHFATSPFCFILSFPGYWTLKLNYPYFLFWGTEKAYFVYIITCNHHKGLNFVAHR